MNKSGGAEFLAWLLLVAALLHRGCVECCVEEERLALLEIKAYMISYYNPEYDDPYHVITWFDNGERDDCCEWSEVRCNASTGRITELILNRKTKRDYFDNEKKPWLFNVSIFHPFKELVLLDLSYNFINGLVEDNGSTKISTLKNLRGLNLDDNNFENGYISVSALTSLRTLTLNGANLNESIFPYQELANLRELQTLDLSYNYFSQPIQGLCELRNLKQLKLEQNTITGGVPSCLQNMSSLQILDLSNNKFTGKLPSALSNLTSLVYLDLSHNYFGGQWSLSTLANHSKLQVLQLSGNMLEIRTTDYSSWQPRFQLQSLGLRNCNLNKLHGTLGKFLLHQLQYNLSAIDLSQNNLVGFFPTWLLRNNSQLTSLDLANNSLSGCLHLPHQYANISLITLDISRNNLQCDVPENIGLVLPMLEFLNMSSNRFEGHIPISVGDMKGLSYLDLSSNNFSGEIPRRLLSHCHHLQVLLLSDNNLEGEVIPEDMNVTNLVWLRLSNNHLGGTIKDALQKSSGLTYLDMSNNQVTGVLPSWIGNLYWLHTLSMSSNDLQGHIPRELCKLQLRYIDLSRNNFSGLLPSCSNFSTLSYMHLHTNKFTGTIPSVLSSCSELRTLDLRNNQLSGGIPYWIHKLSSLTVLLLAGNTFNGIIPSRLCLLDKINILDLSRNKLSGEIPSCLWNMSFGMNIFDEYYFPYMLHFWQMGNGIEFEQYGIPEEVEFLVKNQYLSYTGGVLVLMSGLDLSCNKLNGTIPSELGALRKIRSLNFSHNHLTGSIPASFSNLNQIESLDLSYNNLSATIPPQLVELTFLVAFNVSYNNLIGRVPEAGQFANFDESNYYGNLGLYGFSESQLHDTPTTAGGGGEDGDRTESYVVDFLWSFGMSCTVMFLATLVMLYINPQWRQAWFGFIDWHLFWWMPIQWLYLY